VGAIDGRAIWKDDGTAAGLVAGIVAVLGPDQPISIQVRQRTFIAVCRRLQRWRSEMSKITLLS
jgi:hypothetical protein